MCNEDQQHWLICPHNSYLKLWIQASSNIKSKMYKYNKTCDHKLIKLLGVAILQWRNNKNLQIPEFLSPKPYHLFHQESSIGWNQIIYGRFSRQWLQVTSQTRTKSRQWITLAIRLIWTEVFTIWKMRCDEHHGTTTNTQHKRALLYLSPKISKLYDQQNDLNFNNQYFFNIEVEELLKNNQTVGTQSHPTHQSSQSQEKSPSASLL
jgi:hypothetical protein